MQRMLDKGWVKDGWEDPAEIGGSRPPRRYYELTGVGVAALEAILNEAKRDGRFGALIERFA